MGFGGARKNLNSYGRSYMSGLCRNEVNFRDKVTSKHAILFLRRSIVIQKPKLAVARSFVTSQHGRP